MKKIKSNRNTIASFLSLHRSQLLWGHEWTVLQNQTTQDIRPDHFDYLLLEPGRSKFLPSGKKL